MNEKSVIVYVQTSSSFAKYHVVNEYFSGGRKITEISLIPRRSKMGESRRVYKCVNGRYYPETALPGSPPLLEIWDNQDYAQKQYNLACAKDDFTEAILQLKRYWMQYNIPTHKISTDDTLEKLFLNLLLAYNKLSSPMSGSDICIDPNSHYGDTV